jgi:ribonuclease P protein component
MDRKHRLTSSTDFQRVRRSGKSYAHPLVVLRVSPNGLERTRFGVTTSRGLNNAVTRNRAKRRLRHGLRSARERVGGGWDLVWVARPSLLQADWADVQTAIDTLLEQSGIAGR